MTYTDHPSHAKGCASYTDQRCNCGGPEMPLTTDPSLNDPTVSVTRNETPAGDMEWDGESGYVPVDWRARAQSVLDRFAPQLRDAIEAEAAASSIVDDLLSLLADPERRP